MSLQRIAEEGRDGSSVRALVQAFLLAQDGPRLANAERAIERAPPRAAQVRAALDRYLNGHAQLPTLDDRDLPIALELLDRKVAVDRAGKAWRYDRLRVGNSEYYVHPRPGRFRPPTQRQIDTLTARMRHHWVLPATAQGFQVRIEIAKEGTWSRLSTALNQERVRIAAGRFCDPAQTQWKDGVSLGLENESERVDSFISLLDDARGKGVQILVLPELTASERTEQEVQEWLRKHRNRHSFALVVPGSRHVQRDDMFNETVPLGPEGHRYPRQLKLRPFGDRNDPQRERIGRGSEIRLLATPIGLVATPICRDFCDAIAAPTWQGLGVDWLLVPSMGNGTTLSACKHQARSAQLCHDSTTIVALQPPPGSRPEEQIHGGHLLGRTGSLANLCCPVAAEHRPFVVGKIGDIPLTKVK